MLIGTLRGTAAKKNNIKFTIHNFFLFFFFLPVSLVNVAFEQFVLSEGGGAHRTLVAEVRRLEVLLVVLGDVVEELPLVDLSADWATSGVLPLVGQVLHGGGDEAVGAEEVALQALVGEEAELALLAVQRRPVVDHLWMNLDLFRVKEMKEKVTKSG